MCAEALEVCDQAHAGTCPQNQAQDRQARDRRAEALLLAICLCLSPQSVREK